MPTRACNSRSGLRRARAGRTPPADAKASRAPPTVVAASGRAPPASCEPGGPNASRVEICRPHRTGSSGRGRWCAKRKHRYSASLRERAGCSSVSAGPIIASKRRRGRWCRQITSRSLSVVPPSRPPKRECTMPQRIGPVRWTCWPNTCGAWPAAARLGSAPSIGKCAAPNPMRRHATAAARSARASSRAGQAGADVAAACVQSACRPCGFRP